MKLYVGIAAKEKMAYYATLGAEGFLTNSNLQVELYGQDKTLEEITAAMVEDSVGLPLFVSIHGKDCEEIVNKAKSVLAVSDKVTGVKILASPTGFQAINVLSKMGVKCIVTGLYTIGQALEAAQVGAFAISPFIARGQQAGMDMENEIMLMRLAYDDMIDPPMILAASIRTMDDVLLALRAGAQALAMPGDLFVDMMSNPYSRQTEISFGRAFAMTKGEDVSYLNLGEDKEEKFVE